MKKIVIYKEAAEAVGVTRAAVSYWVKHGFIKGYIQAATKFVDLDEVKEFATLKEVPTKAKQA